MAPTDNVFCNKGGNIPHIINSEVDEDDVPMDFIAEINNNVSDDDSLPSTTSNSQAATPVIETSWNIGTPSSTTTSWSFINNKTVSMIEKIDSMMDLHRCGDCQKDFNSFENFLIHKLLIEQYKLTLEPSERIPGLRLPRFIKSKSVPVEDPKNIVLDPEPAPATITVEDSPPLKPYQKLLERSVPIEKEGVKDILPTEEEPDVDSEDNISVSSQTESLKIDESAKDSLLSPHRDGLTIVDGKQKPFCKICGRYYKNKVVLRVHQDTVHSISRPYVCEYCRLAFKSKGSLVRHTRTHTGERPFKCKECNRGFHDSGTLSRHMHKLHPGVTSTRPNEIQVFITRLVPEINSCE